MNRTVLSQPYPPCLLPRAPDQYLHDRGWHYRRCFVMVIPPALPHLQRPPSTQRCCCSPPSLPSSLASSHWKEYLLKAFWSRIVFFLLKRISDNQSWMVVQILVVCIFFKCKVQMCYKPIPDEFGRKKQTWNLKQFREMSEVWYFCLNFAGFKTWVPKSTSFS